jgi:triosephosphate isomerase (TIM)
MKKLFIVANWKSNKTVLETEQWFQTVNNLHVTFNNKEKVVIVCPVFTSLPIAKQSIVASQLSIVLGSQDVSPFPAGAFTGEVTGGQVKEFAEYVIIGHSERREHFGETDELLVKKVEQARQAGLEVIFCVQGKETPVPPGITIVAYEPISAIGSGNPDTPENANNVAQAIRQQHPEVQHVLYGGSVAGDNVHGFTERDAIDGVLVGGASLDPEKFMKIIINA